MLDAPVCVPSPMLQGIQSKEEGLHAASCQRASSQRLHRDWQVFQHNVLHSLGDVSMLELRVLTCSQLHIMNPRSDASAHVHRRRSAQGEDHASSLRSHAMRDEIAIDVGRELD